MSKFRIRRGEWEVEYEGEDSEEKYSEVLEWFKSLSPTERVVGPETAAGERKPKSAKGRRRTSTSQPVEAPSIDLPSKGELGVLQFSRDSLKYPANSYNVLNVAEAAGLMLAELDRPLAPIVITGLLNKGWKKVSRKTVTSQLTGKDPQFVLSKYAIKEGEGYRLTPEGLAWVRNSVLRKLKENRPTHKSLPRVERPSSE